MDLTPDRKAKIDSMEYRYLLYRWRFAPVGDPWFQGETGEYWGKRMKELREQGENHVQSSKKIGWGR